ncbi:hypothetical protein J2045_003333 [Peteryoungia aggregata LMG 23059]|uniref:Baseplate protein J-like domain-containing protein n=1 Tax=Peteryoungia aggregata LMG 23059 TaxID=1368425 RepID=A0ABU0GAA4_9HYPH|nr:hypothetical protein [Peteryoungia aggregata]MDQ0422285.1 hypothetical protein [Peteryoungia aggregata LMG 23059]
MSLYTDTAWGRSTKLSQEELNKRAKIIADAIEELRAFAPSWEAQVEALRAVGLERINDAILPAYEQLIEASNLGALFSANSDSSVDIGLGSRTFLIRETQRRNFAPTPFVMAYAGGEYGQSVVGTVSSYDSETGELVVAVVSSIGTGTFDDWTIGPIATTADLETLRTQVLAAQTDVAANKAVVDTKHAAVVAIGSLYYGPLAAPPVATPPAVIPLGAKFLDTSVTPNVEKVLTTTGWAPTVTVSVGGRRTQDYVAATTGLKGPFTVDGGYSTGDIYVNGVMLRAPAEVTLAPGPTGTFTFVEGLAAGDIVSFRGFLANDATDIYTKSETNSGFIKSSNPVAGLRNKLLNGDFHIWQRGVGTFTIGDTGSQYTADRWWLKGGSGSGSQVGREVLTAEDVEAIGGASVFGLFWARTVAGSLPTHLMQPIEGVETLAGKKVTVTLWARAASDTQLTIDVEQYFGTGGSPSAAVISTPVTITATSVLTKFTAVLDVPSIVGKTVGTNGNDCLRLRLGRPTDSPNPLVRIVLAHVSMVEGDASNEADPGGTRGEIFERILCRRYYETGAFGHVNGVANASIAGSVSSYVYFQTTKRIVPSVIGTETLGTFAATNITVDGMTAGRSNVVANRSSLGTFTADAELFP